MLHERNKQTPQRRGHAQVGRMAGLTDLRLRLKRMSEADAQALAALTALRSLDLEVGLDLTTPGSQTKMSLSP